MSEKASLIPSTIIGEQSSDNKSELLHSWLPQLEGVITKIEALLPDFIAQRGLYKDQQVFQANEDRCLEFFTRAETELGDRLAVGLDKSSYLGSRALAKYDYTTLSDYHQLAATFHRAAKVYFIWEKETCQQSPDHYGIYVALYKAKIEFHQLQEDYHRAVVGETNSSKRRKMFRACRRRYKYLKGFCEAYADETDAMSSSLLPGSEMYIRRYNIAWTIGGYQVPLKPKNLSGYVTRLLS